MFGTGVLRHPRAGRASGGPPRPPPT